MAAKRISSSSGEFEGEVVIVLGIRGAYHPISHLNTYAERVRPKPIGAAIEPAKPTPTAMDDRARSEMDDDDYDF